jgi:hypothetical protein
MRIELNTNNAVDLQAARYYARILGIATPEAGGDPIEAKRIKDQLDAEARNKSAEREAAKN